MHDRQGADRIEVAGLRGIDAGFALRHHDDGLVFAQGINELNRALPAHSQGQHGMGEKYRIPHRQDGQNPRFFFFCCLVLRSGRVFSFLPFFYLECPVLKF